MSDEQPITEAELQAYADGRLAAGRRAEVDAWLAAHPEDAERIAAYEGVREELRSLYDQVLAEPVPERLERAARGKSRSHDGGSRWRAAAIAAGLTIAGVALGGIAGWNLHGWRAGPTAAADGTVAMARRAAVAHAVYSPEVRHPVEVGADQEQHRALLGRKERDGAVQIAHYQGIALRRTQGELRHFVLEAVRGARRAQLVDMYVVHDGE